MRWLIEKLSREVSRKTKLAALSLPSKITYSELVYRTTRGFLAKKLGQYIGLQEMDTERLFSLSLSKRSFEDAAKEKQYEYLICLSEQMLKWNEMKQYIPSQIKKLDLDKELQNALLKAYEIYELDLFSFSHQAERKETRAQISDQLDPRWIVYKDVMYAATQGKLLLITKEDIPLYQKGHVFCQRTIKSRSDIPLCRNMAKAHFESENISKSVIMSRLLVLSEAITNTIKHAGEGKMTLVKDEENKQVRFIIEDHGPGFKIEDLPKLTLLEGYSTKKSLGQGFTLMMKMSNQLLLSTSATGSTVILVFDFAEKSEKLLHGS